MKTFVLRNVSNVILLNRLVFALFDNIYFTKLPKVHSVL